MLHRDEPACHRQRRERLLAIIGDCNSLQKHVWRARIVLLSAEGHGTAEIMRQAGVAKTAVWRWQERFMQAGANGLLRDKTASSQRRLSRRQQRQRLRSFQPPE
jgi:transposase